jgi:hypothetical protein
MATLPNDKNGRFVQIITGETATKIRYTITILRFERGPMKTLLILAILIFSFELLAETQTETPYHTKQVEFSFLNLRSFNGYCLQARKVDPSTEQPSVLIHDLENFNSTPQSQSDLDGLAQWGTVDYNTLIVVAERLHLSITEIRKCDDQDRHLMAAVVANNGCYSGPGDINDEAIWPFNSTYCMNLNNPGPNPSIKPPGTPSSVPLGHSGAYFAITILGLGLLIL